MNTFRDYLCRYILMPNGLFKYTVGKREDLFVETGIGFIYRYRFIRTKPLFVVTVRVVIWSYSNIVYL